MSNELKDLQSFKVFEFFKEMNTIPRGSGNEKAVSDWLVKFAKDRNLEVIQDDSLNVIIKKPGTKGYENSKPIIIQGHMDMVCEKEANKLHDFTKDPIEFIIDGDNLKADKTTLGGDDGIAVAFGLSILDDNNLKHPPIELLLTTEEETGMGGATNLDAKNLEGRTLINIDSEEEGKFLVSCSGGTRVKISVPVNFEKNDSNLKALKIKIDGLQGGHSGMEIDKQRGNANKLIGRFLVDLDSVIDFKLVSINGGSKNNAIPRDASTIILINPEENKKVEEKINEWNKILKNEYQGIDDDVNISVENINTNIEKYFDRSTAINVMRMLFLIPNGVETMSKAIKGLVQSSNNLGIVITTENEVVFESAVRSSIKSLKNHIWNEMIVLTDIVGGSLELEADYPEWQYNPNSRVRDIFVKTYKEMFEKEPEICAIHAGLECGLLSDKFNREIDQISFGPNIYDVHTPKEHVSISSVERMYKFLVKALEEMK